MELECDIGANFPARRGRIDRQIDRREDRTQIAVACEVKSRLKGVRSHGKWL